MASHYFIGSIDELRIFDRTLTPVEIEEDYSIMGHYPDRDGIIAWYSFDEAAGNVVYDNSFRRMDYDDDVLDRVDFLKITKRNHQVGKRRKLQECPLNDALTSKRRRLMRLHTCSRRCHQKP